MGAFMDFGLNSLASLSCGVLLAVVLCCLVVYIAGAMKKGKRFTPLSWITALVLFLLFAYHSILMLGAFYLKGQVDDCYVAAKAVGVAVDGIGGQLKDEGFGCIPSAENTIGTLKTLLPVLGEYAAGIEIEGDTADEMIDSAFDGIQCNLTEYILWRCFWIVVFGVAGTFCIAATCKRPRFGGRNDGYGSMDGISASGGYDDYGF